MKNVFKSIITDRKDSFPLRHKILNAIIFVAVILMLLGTIQNMLLPLYRYVVIISAVTFLILVFIYYLSRFRKKYMLSATSMSLFFLAVTLPAGWFANAGIISVGGYATIIGIAFTVLYKGTLRVFYLSLLAAEVITLTLIEIRNPDLVIYSDLETMKLDALISLGLLFSSSIGLVAILSNSYAREKENAEKARKEIEEKKSRLEELDQLKNEFIANITHNFISPLSIIMNTAELRLDEDTTAKADFEIIYTASQKLHGSVDKLLKLARMEQKGIELQIERSDIKKMLHEAVEFYASSVSNTGITFSEHFCSEPINDFYTDRQNLEDVLDNVISNAVKFVNPSEGEITVALSATPAEISIRITDNGMGIAKDKLETIFDRYEQGHNNDHSKFSGTGLGLAFSRQIIGYLKGRIRAESDGEGKGATIRISLPRGNVYAAADGPAGTGQVLPEN
ncbi:MAG: HAMP domain-containing histidine kinase [Spirochaetales bacterium]|nr:HAMP domain-containing histidine kinase [Spirochaetales bacterium]